MKAEEFIEINYHKTPFLVSDKLIEDATGKEVGFEEIAEAYSESQLKEAKELLKSASPIWKDSSDKWEDWHKRVKELI